MKQKLAYILIGAVLMFLNFNPVVNAQAQDPECGCCQQVQLEDVEAAPMTNQEINLVEKEERKIKEIKSFNQDIKRNYHKLKTSNEDTRIKYTSYLENGETASIFIKNEIYEHKKTNEIIMTATVADGETGEILKFDAFKSTSKDAEPSVVLSLDYTESLISLDEESGFSTMGFKFDGKSFTCGMVGYLACAQYCAVWGLGTGPVGAGVCGALCTTAMTAACATTVN